MDQKECPQCAETVKGAAKVCRFCGHQFDNDPPQEPDAQVLSKRQQYALAGRAACDASPWKKSPQSTIKQTTAKTGIFGYVCGGAALVALSSLYFVAARPSSKEESRKQDLEQSAKSYIAGLLLDPSSATFKDLTVGDGCVVGDVNGRNLYGGYVGFKRFYYNQKLKFGRLDPSNGDSLGEVMRAQNAEGVQSYLNFLEQVSNCS